MNTSIRVRAAMAVRVRDFLQANPLGYQQGDTVVAQLATRVSRVEELLNAKKFGEQASRNSRHYREDLRKTITRVTLRQVLKVGKALSVAHPDVASGIRRPLGRSERDFMASVNAIVQLVEANQPVFLEYGLSEAGLTELKTQFAEYQRSIGDANLARRTHTGAQAELRVLAREIMTMVQQLDGIVGYQFRGKPELLGAWKSARNVAWPGSQPKEEGGIRLEKPAA